jgi:rhodanese-related sulfurtransferase
MLGYIAENQLSGLSATVQWSDVEGYRDRGAQFVDVRNRDEFATGSLPGAVNIPLDELRDRFHELRAAETIVSCQVGQRGHTAALLLNELGLETKNLDGGYATWRSSPAFVEPVLVA